MKTVKLDGDSIAISNIIGLPWKDNDYLRNDLNRKDKVIAVKVINDIIVDYKKCIESINPKVFTVEQITEDTVRLFQVGTYEQPVVFRMNGFAQTKFKSKNYMNWHQYRILPWR